MSPSPITGGRVVDGQPQWVVAVIGALLPVCSVCRPVVDGQPQWVVAVIGALLPVCLACWRVVDGQPQWVVALIAILLSSLGLFLGYVSW
jgi:hypothetical protein